jgi:hypothetical protein
MIGALAQCFAADQLQSFMKYRSALILVSAIGALARPAQDVLEISKPRPLVIWHGLGQSSPFLISWFRIMNATHR